MKVLARLVLTRRAESVGQISVVSLRILCLTMVLAGCAANSGSTSVGLADVSLDRWVVERVSRVPLQIDAELSTGGPTSEDVLVTEIIVSDTARYLRINRRSATGDATYIWRLGDGYFTANAEGVIQSSLPEFLTLYPLVGDPFELISEIGRTDSDPSSNRIRFVYRGSVEFSGDLKFVDGEVDLGLKGLNRASSMRVSLKSSTPIDVPAVPSDQRPANECVRSQSTIICQGN